MPAIEIDDQNISYGASPSYGWCDETTQWRKLRCDSNGRLLTATEVTGASVFEPTTADTTLNTGATQVFAITNTTNSIVTVLDGASPAALVLPLSSLVAPIFVTTSLVVKSASAALGKEVSVIWKAIT